jgi:hypothetical protein
VSLDPGADLGNHALPVLGVYPGPGQAQAPRHLSVPVLGGYTQDAKDLINKTKNAKNCIHFSVGFITMAPVH